MQLNSQQYEAIHYLGGPLLVIAGAGSGKTGVITHKIAYLIKDANYDPCSICAVTFTNKAAGEMKDRCRSLLSTKSRGLRISTFHRLGLEILHREFAAFNLRKGFSIFDTKDARDLLKDIAKSEDNTYLSSILHTISSYKNSYISPENAIHLAKNEDLKNIAIIYQQYCQRLIAYNAVDFDDLILLPLQILQNSPTVRQYWQRKIRYFLIDEYQDTNNCQYQLMQLLSGVSGHFTAVGDDDQSVYAWRGANPENISNLRLDYPNLKLIKLEQNYRSTQKILNVANQLIKNNPHIVEKNLWSDKNDGENIQVISHKDEEEEARNIIADISLKIVLKQAKLADFAILYRSNYQAKILEQALRERNLAYKIRGGTGFFEYTEIRDLLSYLRLIHNPEDDSAFLRVCNTPKRGIGAQTLVKLGEYARRLASPLIVAATSIGLEQDLSSNEYKSLSVFCNWLENLHKSLGNFSPAEILTKIIEDTEYLEHIEANSNISSQLNRRMERIRSLQQWISKLEQDERYSSLDDLMQHIMLLDILEHSDDNSDAIQLMTLHSSKGLEFPYVYIVGVEEELLPHTNSSDQAGIDEERRLFYVGITRAQRNLQISYVKKRKKAGGYEIREPSRFLNELPDDDIDWLDGRRKVDQEQKKNEKIKTLAEYKELFARAANQDK